MDGIKDGMWRFCFWRIDHVKHDTNSAIHWLVRPLGVIDRVWIKEIPTCIYGIVRGEKLIPE